MTNYTAKTFFLKGIKKIQENFVSIWEHGRDSNCIEEDGLHWTLNGHERPVSISKVEAYLLYNLTILSNAKNAFEVGTGFGYSSFWIGYALLQNSQTAWLGSLDNYSEGSIGVSGREFAREQANELNINHICNYYEGNSPEDIPTILGDKILDIAFIDGNHHGIQPLLDYNALKEFMSIDGYIIFHDNNPRYSVNKAIDQAVLDGWTTLALPTSCNVCVCYRTEDQYRILNEAFLQSRNLMLL